MIYRNGKAYYRLGDVDPNGNYPPTVAKLRCLACDSVFTPHSRLQQCCPVSTGKSCQFDYYRDFCKQFPCWACGAQRFRHQVCSFCTAPPWISAAGPGGVYLLQDYASGLLKIGYSQDVLKRAQTFADAGDIHLGGALWGATRAVEKWLHIVMETSRDERAARRFALPAPTEWFRPTSDVIDLMCGMTVEYGTWFYQVLAVYPSDWLPGGKLHDLGGSL